MNCNYFFYRTDINTTKDKEDIYMSVTAISKANFEQEVLQSDIPVLVDFWAPWCGYCRRLSPVIDQLDSTYEGRLSIRKADIDEEPELADSYDVETIPTLFLFQKGKEPVYLVAPQAKVQVTDWLKENGVE
nr:thioredoxin [uncultured Eisenbergiella sp.]